MAFIYRFTYVAIIFLNHFLLLSPFLLSQVSIVKPAEYPVKPITYSVTSYVYGSGGGASIAATPIPPGALRTGVPLVYGLAVDFDDDSTLASTVSPIKFKWRLPTCTVTQEQAADVDYESTECSNRGVCDRGTGICACYSGYAGYSCSQQTISELLPLSCAV